MNSKWLTLVLALPIFMDERIHLFNNRRSITIYKQLFNWAQLLQTAGMIKYKRDWNYHTYSVILNIPSPYGIASKQDKTVFVIPLYHVARPHMIDILCNKYYRCNDSLLQFTYFYQQQTRLTYFYFKESKINNFTLTY